MNTISSWEAITRELLARIRSEKEKIATDTQRRLAVLEERERAVEKVLETYEEMMGTGDERAPQSLRQEEIKGKSYREILRLIASRNEGLLIARQAIKLMKDANVFGNPDNADAMVYSVLNRSDEFARVGKGVYRLNGVKTTPVASSARKRSTSGLEEAVRELKDSNPQLTKTEALNILIHKGFDFRDKRPLNAVNMAWVRLGYAKKGTEQKPLIEIGEYSGRQSEARQSTP